MMQPFLAHPFDSDRLHEECGVFGVIGVTDAANFVALGLHALQHRGQEAGGIVAHDAEQGFNSAHRFGYVRDNFTKQSLNILKQVDPKIRSIPTSIQGLSPDNPLLKALAILTNIADG